MKIKTVKQIAVADWDDLVEKTYGRTYNFQQQDGCKDRGIDHITVPVEHPEDFENDTVPEEVNHRDQGVSFAAWLARDPKQLLNNPEDRYDWSLRLWWDRNFYPHVDMVINDLHTKGLLSAGDYQIVIDW